ncbi:oxidoreductase molybdopterin binding, partial [sediment metagenome]
AFELDRPLTDQALATTYNNFYEFGSHKNISMAAQALRLRPWTVTIDGMVEEEIVMDAEDLIRRMPIEERLYRLRCVEAWAMAVPWTGFPLAALVDLAQPLSSAQYLA